MTRREWERLDALNRWTIYERQREAIHTARDFIAEAYSDDERDDSPGNMAFAILNAAFDEKPCGRLLVGQGGDTWDPLCVLPAGHAGVCKPASDDEGILLVPREDLNALRREFQHLRAEGERLRELLREVEDDPHARITIGLSERIQAALAKPAFDEEPRAMIEHEIRADAVELGDYLAGLGRVQTINIGGQGRQRRVTLYSEGNDWRVNVHPMHHVVVLRKPAIDDGRDDA